MVTPEERRTLAEQLDANPLWHEILENMERQAVEGLIYASTEQSRVEAQWRVQSVRTFRTDCQAALDNNRKRKGAPA